MNLIGDLILVPVLGITGASLATAVSFCISGILYMHIANREMNLKACKVLIFNIPVIIALLGIVFKVNILILVPILLFIYYLIISGSNLFSTSDRWLLEKIDMPANLRLMARRFYGLFVKRGE